MVWSQINSDSDKKINNCRHPEIVFPKEKKRSGRKCQCGSIFLSITYNSDTYNRITENTQKINTQYFPQTNKYFYVLIPIIYC